MTLTMLVVGSGAGAMSESGGGGVAFLVLRRFFASWSWWPRTVATDLGRCCVIRFVVRPGKEMRWSRRIARRSVVTAGLHRQA